METKGDFAKLLQTNWEVTFHQLDPKTANMKFQHLLAMAAGDKSIGLTEVLESLLKKVDNKNEKTSLGQTLYDLSMGQLPPVTIKCGSFSYQIKDGIMYGRGKAVAVLLKSGVNPIEKGLDDRNAIERAGVLGLDAELAAIVHQCKENKSELELIKFDATIDGKENKINLMQLAGYKGLGFTATALAKNGVCSETKFPLKGIDFTNTGGGEFLFQIMLSDIPNDKFEWIVESLGEKVINKPADDKSRALLHHACQLGKAKWADILIKHGANTRAMNDDWSVAIFAANFGHPEVVEFLLTLGQAGREGLDAFYTNTPARIYAGGGGIWGIQLFAEAVGTEKKLIDFVRAQKEACATASGLLAEALGPAPTTPWDTSEAKIIEITGQDTSGGDKFYD